MNHFQFHYEHTLRSLLIDKFQPLDLSSLESLSFSTTSASFLKDETDLLTKKIGFEIMNGSTSFWTRVKHPLSNFGTKKGQVLGLKGEYLNKWHCLDLFLFLSFPLSGKKGHFGKNREFHLGISSAEGFYPFSFLSMDWNLHLTFSLPSSFLFSSLYLIGIVIN